MQTKKQTNKQTNKGKIFKNIGTHDDKTMIKLKKVSGVNILGWALTIMTLKYAESNYYSDYNDYNDYIDCNECSDYNDSSDYSDYNDCNECSDYNDSSDYNDYNDKVGRSAESIYWAEQSHYSASQVQM